MCREVIISGCLLLAMISLVAAATAGKITYVDATHEETGNTKLASGGVFTPTTVNSGADNLWRLRTGFANSGTVYESGGTFSDPPGVNTEDCPRLVTTVSGLPDRTYKIYVYFWSDDSNWRIRADLKGKDAQLPLFYSRALEQETAPIGAPAATLAKADDLKAVQLLSEGNRMFWQAYLGEVKGTTIMVFVDDDPAHKTHSSRTWYDGIGYQAVTQ